MRKFIAVALAASLMATVAVSGSVGAAQKKTRRVVKSYAGPGGAFGGGGVFTVLGQQIGGVVLQGRTGERFVAIKIADDLGQKVAGSISQDYDGDNFADRSVDFCGATKKPVRIEARYEVVVFISEGPCASGEMGVASRGKVIATFSNIR